jgi:hypothetical protein
MEHAAVHPLDGTLKKPPSAEFGNVDAVGGRPSRLAMRLHRPGVASAL